MDTESNPEALRELERFGVCLVPAVIMGDRAFHGWNPKKLANFVGVQYVEPERLSWAELTNRLDRILAAAQRAMRQVPDKHLGMVSPDRNRTVRNIGYHVFRLSLAHRDAMEQSRFPEEWLLEEAPPNIVNGTQLAQYGQMVRDRLREWFSQPGARDGGVKTYYGYQTAHELLERTVWHAAQHLRQLYVFLERMGERPVAPLTDAEFRGLPLPKEVWS